MPGLFCVHKRLTTSCADCRPQALPKETLAGESRFLTEEERDRKERRRAGVTAQGEAEPKERRAPSATPAAAAALARRQKAQKKITPREAENATAWWVKK